MLIELVLRTTRRAVVFIIRRPFKQFTIEDKQDVEAMDEPRCYRCNCCFDFVSFIQIFVKLIALEMLDFRNGLNE